MANKEQAMSEDRTKFIDYIVGLAAATVGETALLLRQKPRYDSEGNMMYHADGTPNAPAHTSSAALKTASRQPERLT
jgi:hypothetical protein